MFIIHGTPEEVASALRKAVAPGSITLGSKTTAKSKAATSARRESTEFTLRNGKPIMKEVISYMLAGRKKPATKSEILTRLAQHGHTHAGSIDAELYNGVRAGRYKKDDKGRYTA